MGILKPFCGVCYGESAGSLSDLVCPPYDMISDAQAKQLAAKSDAAAVKLEKPSSYEQAAQLLNGWLADGTLEQAEQPALYIYEAAYTVADSTRRMRGVIGALKLPEAGDSDINTHEDTFADARADRMQLLSAAHCNTSPIMALYQDPAKQLPQLIDQLTGAAPDASCEQDGVQYTLWSVAGADMIGRIQELLADKKLYIADGHHRFATAIAYRDQLRETEKIDENHPANFIMALLVEAHCTGLVILPTHRLVSDLPLFDGEKALEDAKEYFNVIPCRSLQATRNKLFELRRKNRNAFGLYADDQFSVLMLKDPADVKDAAGRSDAYCALDIAVLHELFFKKVLAVPPEQISYIQSAKKAAEAVDMGDACCAVFLSATRTGEMLAVADEGENMPQKSTCFYPKPVTGLVLRML